MRKLFYLLAFVVLMSTNAIARDLNSKQLALRNDLFSFLKSEGYQPSIDSDGDIKFKRQGDTYYIIISSNNTSPMYLRYGNLESYSSEYVTKSNLSKVISSVNNYKMCKLTLHDDYFFLGCEMYLEDASAFKSIFDKLSDVIDDASKDLVSALMKLVDN